MAKRDRREYDDDDGRTISNMEMFRDMEKQPFLIPRFDRLRKKKKPAVKPQLVDLTKSEEKAVIRGVRRAVLLGGLAFFAILALFLLFCQFVWFK